MSFKDPVKKALLISLGVSCISLSLKIVAFFVTGSTGALADSAESVVHLFAVIFVVYGYYLSLKPADDNHHYGHERIEFITVGVEGAIIIGAGITILYHAVMAMIYGVDISSLTTGIPLLIAAALINLVLGTYLVRTGRKHDSVLAISNGKHTLTDVWTSGGVIISLALIYFTGWLWLDIIVSLLIAGYICYEAYKLLRYSVDGLMDARNEMVDKALKAVLKNELPGGILEWHHLRHRTSGKTTWVELHTVFEDETSLVQAHEDATILERNLIDALRNDAVVTIHMEPKKAHDEAHEILKGANKKKSLDDFS